MNLRTVYLLMTVIGAAIPLAFFANFAADQGFNIAGLFIAGFVNGAAGGFTADLFISSFVFWIYMWSNRKAVPVFWPFIVINLCIGLSCALPAYLWASTPADTKLFAGRA